MNPLALFLPLAALVTVAFAQPAGGDGGEKEKPAASGIDALELVKVTRVPFRLRVMLIDVPPKVNRPSDVTVEINIIDMRNRTQFVPVGEDIPGTKFKIEAYKHIEKDGKDVSEITILNKQTGAEIKLPLKRIVDVPEMFAIFRYKWVKPGEQAAPDFPKRAGDTFTLPPEMEKSYKVIEVKGRSVVIEMPDGTRKTLTEPPVEAEVCVYGGTPSGVMAAVAAARLGHTVSLVDINGHTGGVVSGGLVATDMGDRKTVGGLADEFFLRIVRHYREKFGDDSPQLKACRNGYTFEPHVAEAVFDAMLAEQPRVRVFHRLRYRSVAMERELPSSRQDDRPAASLEARAPRVTSLTVEDPRDGSMCTFTAKVFIDASYEGDVMAGAHVPYRVGRESRAEFGEYLAGVSMGPKEQRGLGDHRTMAYNYRVSATSDTANRVLFPKPEHYNPSPFVATHGKRIKEGHVQSFGDFFTTLEKAHPGAKYDVNWFDFPGDSEGYADGNWETRDRIAARIRDHAQSLLYYMQNDPELPEAFRTASRAWGLPKDEFADNGHWPFQLYVREGRRMLGRYVLREQDLTQDRWKADGIATGGYGVDCHVVQLLREGGRVVPEHTRHVACNNYDIPYASLTPPDVENLLVPVCCSTTHVAYCSLRMEPVFMMLGHAAGDAAHLALTDAVSVQKVDTQKLRGILLKENAVYDAGYQPQAKLSVTPAHPKPGERAVLKVIASPQNKDAFTKIAWDFDGNGKVSAEGERVVQAFALEKTYTVSALVTDAAGRRRLLTTELPVGAAAGRDMTVDDFDAEDFGRWDGTFPDYIPGLPLRYSDIFTGPGIHRDVTRKGTKSPARIRFQPTLPRAGKYQLCLGFRPAKNQATNVPVAIRHAAGTAKLTVNEREETTPFNFTPVGEFTFKAGDSGFVEIANANTDGRVVIDGVRWVWLGE